MLKVSKSGDDSIFADRVRASCQGLFWTQDNTLSNNEAQFISIGTICLITATPRMTFKLN